MAAVLDLGLAVGLTLGLTLGLDFAAGFALAAVKGATLAADLLAERRDFSITLSSQASISSDAFKLEIESFLTLIWVVEPVSSALSDED